ncbi:MAG: FAD-binding oxidoreductase [candidate division WOR-3 bacterium]
MKPWIEKLLRELGDEVLRTNPEALESRSRDESGLGPFLPEAVILPRNAKDVSATLKIAQDNRIPVYPRGAGTGLTGGALPVRGGICVDTSRMNRILEIDPENLIAVVEPGVITGQLQSEAEALNLFYPPDPASLETCTLGGNLAENAGGPRALKYGLTLHYVLGLELVLPGGETIWLGRKTKKGVTGYELAVAIVGSEGTLGIITQAALRLIPLPPSVVTAMAFFPQEQDACRAVGQMIREGILPRVMELVDKDGASAIRDRVDFALPEGTMLLLETDGHEDGAWAEMGRVAEFAESHGANQVLIAHEEKRARELWSARRSLADTMDEVWPGSADDDICVPRSGIPDAVARARDEAGKLGSELVIFGHAGDGNLHFKIKQDDPEKLRLTREAIYRIALDLGGSLTGEHGVGLLKKDYISWELPGPSLELQRKLKGIFDPLGIMNPGKFL